MYLYMCVCVYPNRISPSPPSQVIKLQEAQAQRGQLVDTARSQLEADRAQLQAAQREFGAQQVKRL